MTMWLSSHDGKELINVMTVAGVYEKNGAVWAKLVGADDVSDVKLAVRSITDLRVSISANLKVI